MKIFLTNIPAFYKINLYNAIATKTDVLVVFTGTGDGTRNKDFLRGNMRFKHVSLQGNVFKKIRKLLCILRRNHYEELIIGGWENIISLLAPFISRKRLNACIIESSIYESQLEGGRGFVKRLYMSRIHRVYASGVSQALLARNLGFSKEIRLTGGCGILNYVEQPTYEPRSEVRNFLYVGRLVEVKNLKLLVSAFNEMPDLHLTIVGYGEQEEELKSLANDNITFTGAIDNKDLPQYYQESDAFVLPSKSEAWGLVIEEALNNGCPVIVSDRVGCRESLVTDKVGLVFSHKNKESLKECVLKIIEINYYNELRKNVSSLNFTDRAEKQVGIYLA